jgi:hypothetical protein
MSEAIVEGSNFIVRIFIKMIRHSSHWAGIRPALTIYEYYLYGIVFDNETGNFDAAGKDLFCPRYAKCESRPGER